MDFFLGGKGGGIQLKYCHNKQQAFPLFQIRVSRAENFWGKEDKKKWYIIYKVKDQTLITRLQ